MHKNRISRGRCYFQWIFNALQNNAPCRKIVIVNVLSWKCKNSSRSVSLRLLVFATAWHSVTSSNQNYLAFHSSQGTAVYHQVFASRRQTLLSSKSVFLPQACLKNWVKWLLFRSPESWLVAMCFHSNTVPFTLLWKFLKAAQLGMYVVDEKIAKICLDLLTVLVEPK